MYKLRNPVQGQQQVIRLSDNAHIPFDEGNVDYQAYLAWIEAGGQPLPADSE